MLETVRIDGIAIAQRKDEISLSLPMAYETDEADKTHQTRAAADTNKHIGKRDKMDDDYSSPAENNADHYVVDPVVDHSVKEG